MFRILERFLLGWLDDQLRWIGGGEAGVDGRGLHLWLLLGSLLISDHHLEIGVIVLILVLLAVRLEVHDLFSLFKLPWTRFLLLLVLQQHGLFVLVVNDKRQLIAGDGPDHVRREKVEEGRLLEGLRQGGWRLLDLHELFDELFPLVGNSGRHFIVSRFLFKLLYPLI